MNLEQHIQRVRAARRLLIEGLPQAAEVAAFDLAALVKQRIVQTGKKADGSAFSPYSEKEGPAFWYKGRSRKGSAEAAVTALGKKGGKLSYKKFRQLNGLNTGHKSFEFTGGMWRNVGVRLNDQGTRVQATIEGESSFVADLLRWHSEREKTSLLKPSADEIRIAEDGLRGWIREQINKALI